MKNIFKLSAVLFCYFLISNTSTAQVTFDFDKDADFTTFKTYSFGGWQENSDHLINDIDKKRILDSFKSEFTQRNMDFVLGDADVVVTLFFVIDQKTSQTAYTDYHGGMGMGYGYGMGYRPAWGWGTGYSTTTYSENDYNVGTFVVDIYDAKTKKLVWQGVSKKTINEKADKRAKTIPKGVSKLMKKYPVDIVKK